MTRYADGNPRAFTAPQDLGIGKLFDIAFNEHVQAFVTANGNNEVARYTADDPR